MARFTTVNEGGKTTPTSSSRLLKHRMSVFAGDLEAPAQPLL
jgi:hypothetical protein